ncbi:MAG: stalk domain-containing protein [Clostridia bacterium]
MKKIICTLLAGAMLLPAASCLAADVNIKINGEEFIAKNALGEVVEPFIKDGSTYLPVRAMGEAVGKEVSFDAENYAVYVGSKPMATDVEAYPYVQIEDKIYTDGFLKFGFRTENFILSYKMEKLIENKIKEGLITKEDIEKSINDVYASYGETEESLADFAKSIGVKEGEIRECFNLLAGEIALLSKIEVPEDEYDNFVTVKHILAGDKETAENIIAALNDGESFEKLIEEYNIDPGQSANSTYTFTYGEMVEPFEKAAFALLENEYTKEPVGTDYGYHIILRLPLDRENADMENYKVSAFYDEVNSIPNPTKIVFVTKGTDAYGMIEGMEITSSEFEFLGATMDSYYEDAFDLIKELFAVERVCNSGYLSEEEIKEAYNFEYSPYEGVSEDFAVKVTAISNMIETLNEKFAKDGYGDTYQAFIIAVEEAKDNVEAKVYKDIRVYVDGNILIPSDVNNNYVKPLNIDGTVYVPVRAIVESLGMTAEWDNDARCVIINK